jgi:hypothetical protein
MSSLSKKNKKVVKFKNTSNEVNVVHDIKSINNIKLINYNDLNAINMDDIDDIRYYSVIEIDTPINELEFFNEIINHKHKKTYKNLTNKNITNLNNLPLTISHSKKKNKNQNLTSYKNKLSEKINGIQNNTEEELSRMLNNNNIQRSEKITLRLFNKKTNEKLKKLLKDFIMKNIIKNENIKIKLGGNYFESEKDKLIKKNPIKIEGKYIDKSKLFSLKNTKNGNSIIYKILNTSNISYILNEQKFIFKQKQFLYEDTDIQFCIDNNLFLPN